jgi:arylsulfatase A-like enzyme
MKKLLFLYAFICLSPLDSATRPNVVVFLSDDQGWGDLSLNGNTNLSTPNIDSLARDGASFESFYVCPVCSPTRAEFLTGRYHPRGGVYSTSAGGERLDLDEQTIGDVFKAAGYATGAFGKWHNGMQAPYHPNSRGFEEFYGFCSGHWGNYFDALLEHNGKLVKGKGFCVDDFTDKAMAFIEKSTEEGKPFFAYLPYNTPHSPMQVPDRWWDAHKDNPLKNRTGNEDIQQPRAALAMCENIDWNVGRLLAKLDDLKVSENTIVMYFNDNGPNGNRWNGGMKGRKGSTDEGGVRSPLLVRWPAKISKGTKISQISGAMDLLPSLADLCGVEFHARKPLDGMSIAPLLLGEEPSDDLKKRRIFSRWGTMSVRSQQFRLDAKGNLYDLSQDIGQKKDVSKVYPDVAEQLRKELKEWGMEMKKELDQPKRPFPLGHSDSPFTQVPARDAKSHGGLKRSNKFPNCSYFGNWTSKEDFLTWDVDVQNAGKYKVQLWYGCEKDAVGTKLKLSSGNMSVVNEIPKANPVKDKGMENDRVLRKESYVKDFIPMDLGTIELEKGSSELKLEALDIPGKEAIEFRMLYFVKL